MKIIETETYKNKRHRQKNRNLKRDLFQTRHNLPGGKYRRVRGEPPIEDEESHRNAPSYSPPVSSLDDPVVINEIREALIAYPGVDIETLANGLRVPIEHVQQVFESMEGQ